MQKSAAEYERAETVFAGDYTEKEAASERLPSELELAALKRQLLGPQPYCVDERASLQFYTMLTACNQLARTFSGRIRATLDYGHRSAEIVLECASAAFDRRRLEVLQALAAKVLAVRISAIPDGFFQIYIQLPYFKPY